MLASHAAYADISGKVFRDFNANGTQDNSSGFNERGVGGVAVSCTDSAGGSGSTTTSADDHKYLHKLSEGLSEFIEVFRCVGCHDFQHGE